MNREDIIRLAREAGLHYSGRCTLTGMESHIERFAALVASVERNRCVARADIALLGADITLRDRVLKAINIRGQT